MSDSSPREKLQEIEARASQERGDRGLWGLIQSIHSDPALRALVTMESQPLSPMTEPAANGGEAVVHLLLALPDAEGGYQPPWAHLAWAWPSRRLLDYSDIRDRLDEGAGTLTAAHRCSKEFADAIEKALGEDRRPPRPPAPIPDLLAQVLGRSRVSGGAEESVEPVQDTEPPPPPLAQPAVAAKPPPDGAAERTLVIDRTDLVAWLQEAETLLRPLQSPDLERELRRLYRRLSSRRFNVVVAGERGRGKSTLINLLLDQHLLPTDLLNSGPTFLEVAAAEEPYLETVSPVGNKERRGYSAQDLQARLTDSSAQGGQVSIGIENGWLAGDGMRLVEIPSSEELDETALARLVDVMVSADAVLLAVNATMALSLSEKSFVERYVLERQTPRVAVVLTYLDMIKQDERREVVNFVRGKLDSWAPSIPLCLAQEGVVPQDSRWGSEVIVGAEALRTLLSVWARSGERQSLIHRQVRSNLRQLLAMARALLESQQRAASLADEERQQEAAQARALLEGRRLDWEELRLEMDRRQLSSEQWLEEKLRQCGRRILGDLLFELRRSHYPREWWERDLPVLLGRQLERTEESLQQSLEGRVLADARWLAGEVKSQFSRHLGRPSRPERIELEAEEAPEAPEALKDLHRLRLYVRSGSLTAGFIGWQVIPLGAWAPRMIGGAVALSGEVFLRYEVKRQREVLSQALPGLLQRIVEEGVGVAKLRLGEAYGDVLEAIQREEEAWLRMEAQGLEASPSDGELDDINRQLTELEQLSNALTGEEEG